MIEHPAAFKNTLTVDKDAAIADQQLRLTTGGRAPRELEKRPQ